MALQRKYPVFGIIGCLCFGIGDWLLGYVDPTLIDGVTAFFVRVGHGASYGTEKVIVTLILAMLGICFLFSGFIHIPDIAKDEKTNLVLNYIFGLCGVSWIVIHFIAAANVLVFSCADKNIGREAAAVLVNGFSEITLPALIIAYLFAAAAMVVLLTAILCGKTRLRRSAAVFTPIVPMAVLAAISRIMPLCPFSYGLYTFCMNGGMIAWFMHLLIKRGKKENCNG